jgi:hypothetical protein
MSSNTQEVLENLESLEDREDRDPSTSLAVAEVVALGNQEAEQPKAKPLDEEKFWREKVIARISDDFERSVCDEAFSRNDEDEDSDEDENDLPIYHAKFLIDAAPRPCLKFSPVLPLDFRCSRYCSTFDLLMSQVGTVFQSTLPF